LYKCRGSRRLCRAAICSMLTAFGANLIAEFNVFGDPCTA
jgi:hypothetical protein